MATGPITTFAGLPQRADNVDVQLTANVTFDTATNLYTYSYSIKNRKGSVQNVTRFVLEASGVVLNAASPQGWTFSHVNYSNRAMAGWTASAMPDPLLDSEVRELQMGRRQTRRNEGG